MYKDHPWFGEPFGALEYYWYLRRGYTLNILFELNFRRFIQFCKERRISPNQLIMKIASRLSEKYLPQYTVALNKKAYPARYPAGYVRKIHPEKDMLEHIAIREKPEYFVERNIRENWQPLVKFLANRFPRFALFLARWVFPKKEVKNNYALMVTRNPMREVGFPIIFHGTDYRTFVLTLPFGEKVWACFGAPHCFGNVDYYKDFIKEFKQIIENPEAIPKELIKKEYRAIPRKNFS